MTQPTRDLNEYAAQYKGDYGFERVMVEYRRRLVLERTAAARPRTVLEVGCGSELVAAHYPTADASFRKWIIVEPSSDFAKPAAAANLPNVVVIEKEMESATAQVLDELGGPPDFIVIASVLHEVTDPAPLLQAAAALMGDKTRLHVNVPNGHSLHRELAVAMGLAQRVSDLSARNLTLLQHRVYTNETLRQAVEGAGLKVVDAGGFFLKPFTHGQMQIVGEALEKVGQSFGPILDGLDKLGRERPDTAAEIYVEAVKAA